MRPLRNRYSVDLFELIAPDAQQEAAPPGSFFAIACRGIVFCSGMKRNRNSGDN
jgi:hypothetical protein